MKNKFPLVSVGIPTYNRPEGLRRTLECITGQTYKNLEIIVSDNCSPGPETEAVAREFMEKYPRIQYFRQQENKGGAFNFKFVLEKATGEYFMWAADDDVWDKSYIKVCLANMGDGVTVFSGYSAIYRNRGKIIPRSLPILSPQQKTIINLTNFSKMTRPSIIYGLHKIGSIRDFVRKTPFFDFFDVAFVIHQIVSGGVTTVPGDYYIADKREGDLQYKPMEPEFWRLFKYSKFFIYAAPLILRSDNLTLKEKIIGFIYFINMTSRFIVNYENTSILYHKRLEFFVARIIFPMTEKIIHCHRGRARVMPQKL
ncbi:MAG: glycosyltransferase family 2 protein [Methanophagales archaeon]|nr:glycosyltransferase family 2 protein [Methanophagales archaeon]